MEDTLACRVHITEGTTKEDTKDIGLATTKEDTDTSTRVLSADTEATTKRITGKEMSVLINCGLNCCNV